MRGFLGSLAGAWGAFADLDAFAAFVSLGASLLVFLEIFFAIALSWGRSDEFFYFQTEHYKGKAAHVKPCHPS